MPEEPKQRPVGLDVDAFRQDALAFFARVPEPPLYRRKDDPARARAGELADEAGALLRQAAPLGEQVAPFVAALARHAEGLRLVEANKVEAAEAVWQAALGLEREATKAMRLWRRSDEGPRPVFDRARGTSRFDPQPAALVTATLACPTCRKADEHRFSPAASLHRATCRHCGSPFEAYFAEVRSTQVDQAPGQRRRRYVFRVEELTGAQTRVEVEDASPGILATAPRDLLAFLYAPAGRLRGVLNLNSSRVLWLTSGGPCFVATVAYGEGAWQLEELRRFRDRVLARRRLGRRFIAWYYRRGPALAGWVGRSPALRVTTRRLLDGVVAVLAASGEEWRE